MAFMMPNNKARNSPSTIRKNAACTMIPKYPTMILRAGGNAATAPTIGSKNQATNMTPCQKIVNTAISPTARNMMTLINPVETAVAIREVG